MKESKAQVEKAVLTLGESLDMGRSVELLLKNIGLHSTIKEVVYKSFIDNRTDYFEENDDVYEAYQLIRRYSKEMCDKGEVIFGS